MLVALGEEVLLVLLHSLLDFLHLAGDLLSVALEDQLVLVRLDHHELAFRVELFGLLLGFLDYRHLFCSLGEDLIILFNAIFKDGHVLLVKAYWWLPFTVGRSWLIRRAVIITYGEMSIADFVLHALHCLLLLAERLWLTGRVLTLAKVCLGRVSIPIKRCGPLTLNWIASWDLTTLFSFFFDA